MMKLAGNHSLTFHRDNCFMRSGPPSSFPAPDVDFDAEAEVLALSEQTARLIAVATALVASRRHVDVQGLQNHVGLLCAKALDLPPSKTGFLKLELKRLALGVDALTDSMRANAA